MYQAYNVEETKNQHLETEKNNVQTMQHRFKCEHTFIADVAVLQLRMIAMAYRPEFIASPVEDLGCHVVYSTNI